MSRRICVFLNDCMPRIIHILLCLIIKGSSMLSIRSVSIYVVIWWKLPACKLRCRCIIVCILYVHDFSFNNIVCFHEICGKSSFVYCILVWIELAFWTCKISYFLCSTKFPSHRFVTEKRRPTSNWSRQFLWKRLFFCRYHVVWLTDEWYFSVQIRKNTLQNFQNINPIGIFMKFVGPKAFAEHRWFNYDYDII